MHLSDNGQNDMLGYIKAKTIPATLFQEDGVGMISLLGFINTVTKKFTPTNSSISTLKDILHKTGISIEQLAEEFAVKVDDLKAWLEHKDNNNG